MNMSVLTEGKTLGDILAWETDARFCRQTYLAEGAVVLGQVLKDGSNAATQKQPAAATDTTACNAVALNAAADGGKVVCLVRGPAILVKGKLEFISTGATAVQKDAQEAALAAVNIIVREGIANVND
jgi:hypothetical protein